MDMTDDFAKKRASQGTKQRIAVMQRGGVGITKG